jgi:hypothetical protein
MAKITEEKFSQNSDSCTQVDSTNTLLGCRFSKRFLTTILNKKANIFYRKESSRKEKENTTQAVKAAPHIN